MVEKVCEVCGAEFSVKPSRAKTAKYCSRKCSDEAKKDRVKRICKVCGNEFETLPSRIKAGRGDCCSIECKTIFRTDRIQVKCATCGKVFESVESHIKGRKNKYCSRACYAKARSKMMSGPNNPLWKDEKLTHKCDWCGKVFEITPSRLKNNSTNCCSEVCRKKLTSKIYRGENHHLWNRVTKTCLYCGKEYTVPQSLKNTSKYCSRKCQTKYMGRLYSGENSPNWKGGISFEPYCPKFNRGFKERVRDFWNHECGFCGKSEENNGKKLAVHHVNYDKMVCCNNVAPLFILLCESCHTKTNYNRDYWEEMFTNYIMIWFDGESYNPVANEITVINRQEITA